MSVRTRPTPSVTNVCAYCGSLARYSVSSLDGRLWGFCCGEPTCWTWLAESVEREEAET